MDQPRLDYIGAKTDIFKQVKVEALGCC